MFNLKGLQKLYHGIKPINIADIPFYLLTDRNVLLLHSKQVNRVDYLKRLVGVIEEKVVGLEVQPLIELVEAHSLIRVGRSTLHALKITDDLRDIQAIAKLRGIRLHGVVCLYRHAQLTR